MLSIVNKIITQLAGESFVWKGLSIIILGLSTLSAYFIKTFYDLEIEISELKAMVSHQELILKSNLEVIAQNQQIIVNNQQQLEIQAQTVELNKVTHEWNVYYTYILIGVGVIGTLYLFPHVLEYVMPTDKGNINLIKTVGNSSKEVMDLIGENSLKQNELSRGLADTLIKYIKGNRDLLNTLLSRDNDANNVGINLNNPNGEAVFLDE